VDLIGSSSEYINCCIKHLLTNILIISACGRTGGLFPCRMNMCSRKNCYTVNYSSMWTCWRYSQQCSPWWWPCRVLNIQEFSIFENVILYQVTAVCICWLKLQTNSYWFSEYSTMAQGMCVCVETLHSCTDFTFPTVFCKECEVKASCVSRVGNLWTTSLIFIKLCHHHPTGVHSTFILHSLPLTTAWNVCKLGRQK
jgi:hypothetical protein